MSKVPKILKPVGYDSTGTVSITADHCHLATKVAASWINGENLGKTETNS
jgi:hypothetical protein